MTASVKRVRPAHVSLEKQAGNLTLLSLPQGTVERSVELQPGPLPHGGRYGPQQDGRREGAGVRPGQAALHRRVHRTSRGLPVPGHPAPEVKVQRDARRNAGHDAGVRADHEAQALSAAGHAATRLRAPRLRVVIRTETPPSARNAKYPKAVCISSGAVISAVIIMSMCCQCRRTSVRFRSPTAEVSASLSAFCSHPLTPDSITIPKCDPPVNIQPCA